MTFKVGDKVRIVAKDCGHGFKIGQVVTLEEKTGATEWFAGEYYVQEKEFTPIGKTLTELDVKPGDVVRDTTDYFCKYGDFTCKEIIADMPYKGQRSLHSYLYGEGIFDDSDGKWIIVSRAPTAEPAKPKRMHPDDVAHAMMEYARDCGYEVAIIDIRSEYGTHTYSF